jgi:hypothetical protein
MTADDLFGRDLFGDVVREKSRGPVADRFVYPPFSVLDARGGDWQERKRAWIAMGLKSEEGRGDALTYSAAAASLDYYRVKEGTRETSEVVGTSIFDPVLCELAFRWFTPPGGVVVDPFAGGSVRGAVASALGFRYWGCDLRAEQIRANEAQADAMALDPRPTWVCGDSMETLATAPAADFVFSCPPYGDLERYSDDPADLSAMEWHTFSAAYRRIIFRSVERLKLDSFACFVVGDFRDPRGFYRGFVQETCTAFEQAGARLYNDAVLVTAVGSASMRVNRQFGSNRKMVKTHQNMLVFCKGSPEKAAAKCKAPA